MGTKLEGNGEERKLKEKEPIKSPIMSEMTTGSLKKTWGKTDTGHMTAESVTPPFYNLIRNGKFDLQVVTCQQEFWVTRIPAICSISSLMVETHLTMISCRATPKKHTAYCNMSHMLAVLHVSAR